MQIIFLLFIHLFSIPFSSGYYGGRWLRMAGFGTPKATPKNDKKGSTSIPTSSTPLGPIIRKGEGTTYTNHCPTLNRSYPHIRCVHHDPPVFEIDQFLSHEACDAFIDRAQTHGVMINSRTFSADASSKRTSTTWYNNYDMLPEMLDVLNRLTGCDIHQFEEPQVVRYEIGQQFSWHYDAIPKSMQDSSGNRIATCLIYLNDVDSGGATTFKDLNIQVKPQKGKGLLFFPSFHDGKPDDRTMHAGQVCMDTKWIAQIWIHERTVLPKTPAGTNHQAGIDAVERLRAAQKS